MKPKTIAVILTTALFLTGCAIFQPVKPEETITHPLGTDSLKIGMTKNEVKSILGEPDAINPIGRTKDMLNTQREEWVYKARYSDIPLKADYFGKTLHLVFDGNNLTSYKSPE